MNNSIIQITKEKNGVACITLNRPEVHNAFNPAMIEALHQAVLDAGKDNSIRMVKLAGAGKSFSAGADLDWMKEAATYNEAQNIADAHKLSALLEDLAALPKPTIALVHGAAIAGGTGLVACCDIALAQKTAIFGISEVRIGLIPAMISPYVVGKIGARQARRYFLTGERFDAETAQHIGLVHEVVENDAELVRKANQICDEILKGAPVAISDTKQLIAEIAQTNVSPARQEELAAKLARRRASPEAVEGITAFLEKRSPNWSK